MGDRKQFGGRWGVYDEVKLGDKYSDHISIKPCVVQDLGDSFSHIYAFEIGWREMVSAEEDYFDPGLGIPLLNKYEFSFWNNERDAVTGFYFINENICKELNLDFSLKELCYYKGEERIVEVFQSTSSLFYYIRQDILEEILEKFNVHLDFKMYAEKFDLKKEVGDKNYRSYKKILFSAIFIYDFISA